MTASSDRLYDLLPVLYRLRDADQGQTLRALMAVIDGQLSEVEADITGLYDNWFIETSDEWVVPYIGDLLGVRGLNTIQAKSFSQRAYVANTLFYRRRKGTAYVLGILAGDVSGWPAHVVEFFELLQTTQYMNHLRLFNTRPDLRDVNTLNLLDTPFDRLAHTADVRHINDRRGKHNIPNLGIFLWRLQNYPLQDVTPRQAEAPHAYGYHFSSLGNPAPLFKFPGEAGFPDEQKVPAPIRPYDFFLDLEAFQAAYGAAANPPENSRYYGLDRSLYIVKDGSGVPPLQVMCKDLSAWDQPPAGKVAVDVALGRLAFAAGEEPVSSLAVSYNYGFSADIGGGPYDRRERVTAINPPVTPYYVGPTEPHTTLADALSTWITDGRPPAVFRIRDSGTYDAHLTIDLPADGMLVIDCENEERPTLVNASPMTINSEALVSEDTAAFTLGGLLIEGSLATSGKLNLTIADCTLVPGRSLDEDGYPRDPDQPSLSVDPDDVIDTSILIARSILGPLELPEDCRGLTISDSLIDAPLAKDAVQPARAAIAASADGTGPGPVTTLQRVTVFGEVHVRELSLASEVIFVHPVTADRRQEGCVRFSYIPDGSVTPRRFHCQPDQAVADRKQQLDPAPLQAAEEAAIRLRVVPQFTSQRCGAPAFAQLATACADEIKTGAENGSEMGVFSLLEQPQRLKNLQVALEEYLRFGLEAGIFFVT
jgi:hypothetical protein